MSTLTLPIDDLPVEKSEILFLYESTYSVPNGDPFTGEQRYDEETKKILVSDVRIKRFVRDHLAEQNRDNIFVLNDRTAAIKKESGAAARASALTQGKGMTLDTFKTLLDVRLFGGIVTAKDGAINLTGPVQFALLNPSLNAVELRMHQNTSVFASSVEKERGAIGTTTVVPYALNQIHGWVNAYSARHSGLKPEDLTVMLEALWDSINNANTRTKSNQNSLLLLQVVYSNPNKKLYGLDRAIALKSKDDKRDEQLRSRDDYMLNFDRLAAQVAASDAVKTVRFYTEDSELVTQLTALGKFEAMKIGA